MIPMVRKVLETALVLVFTWTQAENPDYERGRAALDRAAWEDAIEAFEGVGADDELGDAAWYWRAYAYNKLGESSRALELATSFAERFPESEWRDDARALVVEIRARAGAGSSDDEELKIMALNALMHSDDEDALPMLEEFLSGDHPARLKGRALFVLAQIGSAESYEVLARIARDDGEPELQRRAIRYLGVHQSQRSLDLLADLYASLTSVDARAAILQSFMIAGDEERLLNVARDEANEELRGRAIRLLGAMDASRALAELYQRESSEDVRVKILEAFMVSGDETQLLAVARDRSESQAVRLTAIRLLGAQGARDELWALYGEEDSETIRKRILHGLFIAGDEERIAAVARDAGASEALRREAIHNLGLNRGTEAELVAIYESNPGSELKRQVLHSLFLQDAVAELIGLARAETDVGLKKQAVHWISLTDAPEAKEFMGEILRR